jgi:excisionase family DNA binding protein
VWRVLGSSTTNEVSVRGLSRMIEQHYTVTEIAGLLKCHPETVRRLCDRNQLRSIRVGTNRRIPESAVTEYMDGAQNVVNFKRKSA